MRRRGAVEPLQDIPRQGEALAARIAELTAAADQRCGRGIAAAGLAWGADWSALRPSDGHCCCGGRTACAPCICAGLSDGIWAY